MAFAKGDAKKAEQFYTKVIKLEPKNERNYFKRYRSALRQRKYKEGLADLRKAVSLAPKYKAGWEHRANLELMLGHCQDAASSYANVINLKPGHKKAQAGHRTAHECASHLSDANAQHSKGNTPPRPSIDACARPARRHATLPAPRTRYCLSVRARTQRKSNTTRYWPTAAAPQAADSSVAGTWRGGYRLAEHDMAMRHYRQGHTSIQSTRTARRHTDVSRTKQACEEKMRWQKRRHEEAVELFADARLSTDRTKSSSRAPLKGAKSLLLCRSLRGAAACSASSRN